jgi:hypothetical protein
VPGGGAGSRCRLRAQVSDAGPRATTWSEARARRKLSEFLRSAEEWPSYREFQRAGHGASRAAVTRLGGARCWSQCLGLRYPVRRPRHPPGWTEDRIHTELRVFLRGQTMWPTRSAFELAGRKVLRDAIRRLGGPARWASDFQLPRPDLKSGSARTWTVDRIESELLDVIGDRGTWPSRRELDASGRAASRQRSAGMAASCIGVSVSACPHRIESSSPLAHLDRPAHPQRARGVLPRAKHLTDPTRVPRRRPWPSLPGSVTPQRGRALGGRARARTRPPTGRYRRRGG